MITLKAWSRDNALSPTLTNRTTPCTLNILGSNWTGNFVISGRRCGTTGASNKCDKNTFQQARILKHEMSLGGGPEAASLLA
ncbi:unnamed protein product [Clavelina lepadiformis]|uniref:Uncharacterized protein n=1 Tax=Clavelina lepadiformis TaxID=159417 RepID=A0ABP0G7Z7_CLALP